MLKCKKYDCYCEFRRGEKMKKLFLAISKFGQKKCPKLRSGEKFSLFFGIFATPYIM